MTHLLLVDANSLCHRAADLHAAAHGPSGEPNGCVVGGLVNLFSAVKAVGKIDHLVLCWDEGVSAWRRALFPGYKTSPKTERLVPQASVERQMHGLFALCEMAGLVQVRILDVEADDVHGVLSARYAPEMQVTIACQDADLHQLVGPNVRLWETVQRKWMDEKALREKYGPYKSRHLLEYFTLAGLAGDDIPAVPGVGAMTAAKMLDAVNWRLDNIFECPSLLGKGKVADRVRESTDLLRLARRLIAIPRSPRFEGFTTEQMDALGQSLCPPPIRLASLELVADEWGVADGAVEQLHALAGLDALPSFDAADVRACG